MIQATHIIVFVPSEDIVWQNDFEASSQKNRTEFEDFVWDLDQDADTDFDSKCLIEECKYDQGGFEVRVDIISFDATKARNYVRQIVEIWNEEHEREILPGEEIEEEDGSVL